MGAGVKSGSMGDEDVVCFLFAAGEIGFVWCFAFGGGGAGGPGLRAAGTMGRNWVRLGDKTWALGGGWIWEIGFVWKSWVRANGTG